MVWRMIIVVVCYGGDIVVKSGIIRVYEFYSCVVW